MTIEISCEKSDGLELPAFDYLTRLDWSGDPGLTVFASSPDGVLASLRQSTNGDQFFVTLRTDGTSDGPYKWDTPEGQLRRDILFSLENFVPNMARVAVDHKGSLSCLEEFGAQPA